MPLNEKIEEIFHRWRWAENADDFLSEISTGSLGDPFPALVNYLSHEDETLPNLCTYDHDAIGCRNSQ